MLRVGGIMFHRVAVNPYVNPCLSVSVWILGGTRGSKNAGLCVRCTFNCSGNCPAVSLLIPTHKGSGYPEVLEQVSKSASHNSLPNRLGQGSNIAASGRKLKAEKTAISVT